MNPSTTSGTSTSPHHYGSLDHSAVTDYQNAQAAAAAATAALSQNHINDPARAISVNGKKRRTSGIPGSRGVANLTPEQLAKKRANDREAQRAIRERTRNTIELLEKRIQELEAQPSYQELQRVIGERDRALAECEQLRRRLGAVAGIVGGGHPSLNELANLTAQQSPLPSLSQQTHVYGPPTPATSYEGQSHLAQSDRRSPHLNSQTSPQSQASPIAHPYPNNEQNFRKWPTNESQHGSHSYSSPNGGSYEQHDSHHNNGERHGLSFLLDQPHQHAHPSPNNAPHHSHRDDQQPIWARLTNIGENTCVLDSVLKDFIENRRRMLREGASIIEAAGPDTPSYATLLSMCFPSYGYRDVNGDDVSSMVAQILHKFPDVNGMPELVACFSNMFNMIRWLIRADQPCFDRLPDWIRPIPEQYDTPHGAWLDYLPWPTMRRKFLIGADIKFDDFFVPYTKTLSLNWPHHPDTVLQYPNGTPISPTAIVSGSGELGPVLNPLFDTHYRKLENWVLGTSFQKAFPSLVDGTVTIRG